jgi:hypothetical protein
MNEGPDLRVHEATRERAVATHTSAADLGAPDAPPKTPADQFHGAHPDRHPRRWLVLSAVVLVATAAVTVVTVGSGRPTTSKSPAVPARPIPDAHASFPYETASDVVSYADYVATVTAISEREAPPSVTPEGGAPSDTVSRLITFRVDEVLWSRAGARTAPTRFSAAWWGWLKQGHRPFVVDGTPWVFKGGHYVVPIAFDGKEFSILQPFAVFRLQRGAVTLEQQSTTLARSLSGGSRAKIAEVFRRAAPAPIAVRYADLLPRDRLNAVIAARKSTR